MIKLIVYSFLIFLTILVINIVLSFQYSFTSLLISNNSVISFRYLWEISISLYALVQALSALSSRYSDIRHITIRCPFFIIIACYTSSLTMLQCVSFLSQAVTILRFTAVLSHHWLVVVVVLTGRSSFAPEQWHDYVDPHCTLWEVARAASVIMETKHKLRDLHFKLLL